MNDHARVPGNFYEQQKKGGQRGPIQNQSARTKERAHQRIQSQSAPDADLRGKFAALALRLPLWMEIEAEEKDPPEGGTWHMPFAC